MGMQVSTSADPFATLGVAPRFDVDVRELEQRHRALSGALHPDRYVARPAGERRLALDKAIAVNTAFRALRDPVRRAETLLELRGVPVGETVEPKASPALLMEMMELGEQLAEAKQARDLDRIGRIGERIRAQQRELTARLAKRFDAAGDDQAKLGAVVPLLGELRYLGRFVERLEQIEERLLD